MPCTFAKWSSVHLRTKWLWARTALQSLKLFFSWQRRRHQRLQDSFRIVAIKITFHFKISWLATIEFKEPRKKTKKTFTWQWRNRKEKERLEENGEKMKRQMNLRSYTSYTRTYLKLGGNLLITFKKLPIFKML